MCGQESVSQLVCPGAKQEGTKGAVREMRHKRAGGENNPDASLRGPWH